MPSLRTPILALTAAISAASLSGIASADTTAAAEDLEQRILILERKLEIQAEEAAARATTTPTVTVNDRGFTAAIAKDSQFRFSGVLHVDHRAFLDDKKTYNDTFYIRRLRPTFSGSIGKLVDYRLTPEFAGSNGIGDAASIVDAYIDVKATPWGFFRVGKQKGPISIERLQSGSALHLIERGLANELAPNREIGITFNGQAAAGKVNYVIGVLNGTADGRDVSTGNDSKKAFEGRLFAEPFKDSDLPIYGLGFGIAGSYENHELPNGVTAADARNNTLPRYRSYGQNQFFSYNTGVYAEGKHTRLAPQISFYQGQTGLLAEYIVSKQNIVLGANELEAENTGYTVTASYVLTGENAGYNGITPATPYAVGGEGWGAVELVARVAELDVDDKVFTEGFANAANSASKASNFVVGVNWHLSRNLKVSTDYSETRFDGGAAAGADRAKEKALFSRLQLAF